MNKPTTLLLDGDILRYELGAILSKGDSITIGGTKIDVPQTEESVRKLVEDKVAFILERTGCSKLRIFLSEGRNFRFERASILPYKGNRKDFVKPYHWKTVGNILREIDSRYRECTDFEADDHMAAEQDVDEGSTCIGSRDKDLRGRSGWHYSWPVGERCAEKPLQWIDYVEAERWFYTQCLTGDSTDNILGCATREPTKTGSLRRKGVGPKKAAELLMSAETEQELFNIVAAQYQAQFGEGWEEYLKENGTLLYMSWELIPWEELENTKELFRKYLNEQY